MPRITEYVPLQFTHPGIQRRAKRQHYDERLLPMFSCQGEGDEVLDGESLQPIGTFKVVGQCSSTCPFTGTYFAAEVIEVTLKSGVVVPCTRLVSDGDGEYVMCQSFAHKAFRPDKRR